MGSLFVIDHQERTIFQLQRCGISTYVIIYQIGSLPGLGFVVTKPGSGIAGTPVGPFPETAVGEYNGPVLQAGKRRSMSHKTQRTSRFPILSLVTTYGLMHRYRPFGP